jgi:hypothetical protein
MTVAAHEMRSFPFGPMERVDPHPERAMSRDTGQPRRSSLPSGKVGPPTRRTDVSPALTGPRFGSGHTAGADVAPTAPVVQAKQNTLFRDRSEHARLYKPTSVHRMEHSISGSRKSRTDR